MKYLKYKIKYLMLKKQLAGGENDAISLCLVAIADEWNRNEKTLWICS